MKTKLSVNLNKIALLRNSRGRNYPNVLDFAKRAIDCGASGITVHPRSDQRHTRYSDIKEIKQFLQAYPDVEFNVEGNPTAEFMALVLAHLPHQCTLVPDTPDQITSDHGWDLSGDDSVLKAAIAQLKQAGIRVSLFMDSDAKQVERVKAYGADRIELYTEDYARQFDRDSNAVDAVLSDYIDAANAALEQGLMVNAGHDLNLENLALFLDKVPDVAEVSIGHAITIESFDYGFDEVVSRYASIVNQNR